MQALHVIGALRFTLSCHHVSLACYLLQRIRVPEFRRLPIGDVGKDALGFTTISAWRGRRLTNSFTKHKSYFGLWPASQPKCDSAALLWGKPLLLTCWPRRRCRVLQMSIVEIRSQCFNFENHLQGGRQGFAALPRSAGFSLQEALRSLGLGCISGLRRKNSLFLQG